jgi:hypothetical protein
MGLQLPFFRRLSQIILEDGTRRRISSQCHEGLGLMLSFARNADRADMILGQAVETFTIREGIDVEFVYDLLVKIRTTK